MVCPAIHVGQTMANSDTNTDRPKAFLRSSRYALLSLSLVVVGLIYSFEVSRQDLSRQLDVAHRVQSDSANAISALVQQLPATLSAEEVGQIGAIAELKQSSLQAHAQTLEPHSASTMDIVRPVGAVSIVAIMLWLAWSAFRMEREIALKDARTQARLSTVETLLGYMRGARSLENVDEALAQLHEVKGEGPVDRRLRRVFQALQGLREEVVAKIEEADRLRSQLQKASEAITEAEAAGRAHAVALQGEMSSLHDRLADVDRVFSVDALARLQELLDERQAQARELSGAAQKVSRLERSLEITTDRLSRSLDLNTKTVKLIGKAETLIAAVAESSTKINERANKISGIVSKTDMLSLNASIEAVKAGAAGKGFAVVAEEVKGVVGQISEQLAFVMQETVEVHGGSEKTSSVIKQVVELSSASDDIIREIEAATDEMADIRPGFEEDDTQNSPLSNLRQAQGEIESIQRALKALTTKTASVA